MEGVSDCCSTENKQLFSYILVRTSYISMRRRWCLFCTRPTTLNWIFLVLAYWNNSLWDDMYLHSDTLSWFQAIQARKMFFFFFFNFEFLQYFLLAFNISKVRHWSPVLNWNMFLTPNSSPCLALSPAIPLKYLLAFWFCIATLSNCLNYTMNWQLTFNVTNWWFISNSYLCLNI